MKLRVVFTILLIPMFTNIVAQSIEDQIIIIDSLPITSTFFEISTFYHNEKLNDTSAIIKIKRNENGDLLYYEKQVLPYSSKYAANLKKIPRDSMIIKKYYDLEIGLFYHLVFRPFSRWGMEYRYIKSTNLVSSAQQIHFAGQDTVLMNYEYDFHSNGNCKTRTIHSKSNEPYYNTSEITNYNDQGLETTTYIIIDGKKQLKQSCYYRNGKPYKTFEWEIEPRYKWEHIYDDKGQVIYSKYYRDTKWIASKKYKYDDAGNVSEIKVEDFDIVYRGEIIKFVAK